MKRFEQDEAPPAEVTGYVPDDEPLIDAAEGAHTATIRVYLETGVTAEYEITASSKAALRARSREHHHEIVTDGYRSVVDGRLTTYPPHRIDKVVTEGLPADTRYEDDVSGT